MQKRSKSLPDKKWHLKDLSVEKTPVDNIHVMIYNIQLVQGKRRTGAEILLNFPLSRKEPSS